LERLGNDEFTGLEFVLRRSSQISGGSCPAAYFVSIASSGTAPMCNRHASGMYFQDFIQALPEWNTQTLIIQVAQKREFIATFF
jgi:hypothetical protein